MDQERFYREQVDLLTGEHPEKCMSCGKCTASCPSFDEMPYPPHRFVSCIVKGNIQELMDSPAIYQCLSCFACVERCPRGIEPARLVEAVRLLKERPQDGDHLDANTVSIMAEEGLPQQAITSAMRKYCK